MLIGNLGAAILGNMLSRIFQIGVIRAGDRFFLAKKGIKWTFFFNKILKSIEKSEVTMRADTAATDQQIADE